MCCNTVFVKQWLILILQQRSFQHKKHVSLKGFFLCVCACLCLLSPCRQARGQRFVARRCRSSPSCRSCRTCLPSPDWRKHPAGTWAPSAAQVGCVWTCTRGRLGREAHEWCNIALNRSQHKLETDGCVFTASVQEQKNLLRQNFNVLLLQLLHDDVVAGRCRTRSRSLYHGVSCGKLKLLLTCKMFIAAYAAFTFQYSAFCSLEFL